MIRKCILWVLTIAVAGVIFFFSGQSVGQSSQLSAEVTDGVLEQILQMPDVTPATHLHIDQILRDLAHVALFALLGLVTALLVRSYTRRWFGWLIAVSSCAVYAVLDECHQLWFAAGRAFQWSDIGKDCLGVLLGVGVAAIASWCFISICRYRQKKGN